MYYFTQHDGGGQIRKLEEESIEWYDENEEDGNTSSFLEDSDEDGHNTAYTHNQDRHDFNVRQDAVERRWGSLYNKESHRKLQNAIVNQLEALSLV
jgi:hypothetical protein